MISVPSGALPCTVDLAMNPVTNAQPGPCCVSSYGDDNHRQWLLDEGIDHDSISVPGFTALRMNQQPEVIY